MNTKGFRIGNKTRHKSGTIVDIIAGWQIDEDDTHYGIPLTEEWLEKLGFVKDCFGSHSINISDHKKLAFSGDGDYLYICEENSNKLHVHDFVCLWNKDIMREFYVHEIQNLYFDLTRKELLV